MPVTNYYTVDGEIIGESRGGVEINYAKDALGSVVGTLVGDTLQNTYAYKPYGALLAKTGTGPDPKFQWVGSLGYRPTSRRQSDYYIRARHYSTAGLRWTSVDPQWPAEPQYSYAVASPTTTADPAGRTPCVCTDGTDGGAIAAQVLMGYMCCAQQSGPAIQQAEKFCRDFGFGKNRDGTICNAMQHCMWACLIVQNCSGYAWYTGTEWSLSCTDMHEKDAPAIWRSCPGYRPVPTPYKPNPPTHKCMDLYNNRIGINCGTANSCYLCCLAHIKTGDVQVVHPPSRLPPRWKPPKRGCRDNPTGVVLPTIEPGDEEQFLL